MHNILNNHWHYTDKIATIEPIELLFNGNSSIPDRFERHQLYLQMDKNYTIVVILISLWILYCRMKLKLFRSQFVINTKLLKLNCLALISLIIFVIVLPVAIVTLLVFSIYRYCIQQLLKFKFKSSFIRLLEGTDSIWAIETKSAYSIITGLAILQVPSTENASDLYTKLLKRINERLFIKPYPYPKLFYQLKSFGGYFYWNQTITNEPNCINYVKQFTINNNLQITQQDLNLYISNICNQELNKEINTWEILIGKQTIEYSTNYYNYFPIIFRVHHTLGDGYSLVQLLLETISIDLNIRTRTNQLTAKYKSTFKTNKKSLINQLKLIVKLFYIPMHLFELICRRADNNSLHNQALGEQKLIGWWSDFDNGTIFNGIKQFKRQHDQLRFTDIILTAIANAFNQYFIFKNNDKPKHLTTVIPTRAEDIKLIQHGDHNIIELTNRFTVGLLQLPLSNGFDLINIIKNNSNQLRDSLQFQVNYCVMKILANILPAPVLNVLVYSEHATCVISNVPGPYQIQLTDQIHINDLIFWIPNRGKTGIGISILTYNNRLQLGILADQHLISTNNEIDFILNTIVYQITRLISK